jgi:hypothetical protein
VTAEAADAAMVKESPFGAIRANRACDKFRRSVETMEAGSDSAGEPKYALGRCSVLRSPGARARGAVTPTFDHRKIC